MMRALPNMGRVLDLFEQQITLRKSIKTIENFEVVERPDEAFIFFGVLTPDPTRNLKIMVQGQREWNYWTLYTETNLDMDSNIFDASGKQYKVVMKNDWVQFGYFQYQLTQTYTN